jgi:hypothetical protein
MQRIYYFFILIIVNACVEDKSFKRFEPAKFPFQKNKDVGAKLVWSKKYNNTMDPVIFFSPHQDDETIGMGASIAALARKNIPVFVVLITNGANVEQLKIVQKTFSNAGMQDLIDARNAEFLAACKTLGVHRVYIANHGSGYDENIPPDSLEKKIKGEMELFYSQFPTSKMNTVSGNCDSYNETCSKMSTHQVCANALHTLYSEGKVKEANLYRVYCYYWKGLSCDKVCKKVKKVIFKDKVTRQNAINQYKLINYKLKRFGLAYHHSVGTLFDNSWNSKFEYLDDIEDDVRLPYY